MNMKSSKDATLVALNLLAYKINQMDEMQLETYEGVIRLEDYCIAHLTEKGIDVGSLAFDSFQFNMYGRELLEKDNKYFMDYGVVSRNEMPFVREYSVIEAEMQIV